LRVFVGFALLYFAGAADGGSWDVAWSDLAIGFAGLPAAMVAVGIFARHFAGAPVHFTGVVGHIANVIVIVALVANPHTAGGAALFYGASMLIAAWRGQDRKSVV
jgi:hypothetical protein